MKSALLPTPNPSLELIEKPALLPIRKPSLDLVVKPDFLSNHKTSLELIVKPALLSTLKPSSGQDNQCGIHSEATPKSLSGLEREEGELLYRRLHKDLY